MKKSLFGLARVYSILPQHLVNLNSVKLFQRHLQRGLLKCAQSGVVDWQIPFSAKWTRMPRQSFDVYFG